jgi:serine/threonine protein kinase
MAVAPGTRFGTCEIVAPLGSGGMGEVYRARDRNLRRDVAIKVLPETLSADPDRIARFEREARAIAALSHPNILAIHDFGNQDGVRYAVTELLEGRTLRDLLGVGRCPRRRRSPSLRRSRGASTPRTAAASSIAISSRTTCSC